MNVGYARVSTEDQNPDLQLAALKKVGCERIFIEKAMGTHVKRTELTRCLKTLAVGDTLIVWELDRLGRSLRDLIGLLDGLKARGVAFHSLTEAIDTATPTGRALWQMVGILAELERSLIQERTQAGRAAAVARGVKMGRKPKLLPTGGPCSQAYRERRTSRHRSPRRPLGARGTKELPGLVLELQSDVLDASIRCSDLLRKALVVSKKLGVEEIQEWLSHELNGYPQRAAIPDYRKIRGSLKVWNPYHGWQPLYFQDAREAELLSTHKNRQPIGELESLVKMDKVGFLQINFPPHIENQLLRGMEVPLQPSLHVPPNQVVGILDAVRNTILEWALELEKQGVIGEGMTFSKEEKQAASNVTYQITHNIGSMQHSQIQHDSPNASQIIRVEIDIKTITDFLQQLRAARDALKLSAEASAELTAEIATLDSQLHSPNPKNSILLESLRSVRNILEGMTGSAIASALLNSLSSIL